MANAASEQSPNGEQLAAAPAEVSQNIDGEAVERWRCAIEPRLARLNLAIAERGDSSVAVVAVSKAQPVEAVLGAHQLGVRCFGENYAQEALAKMKALRANTAVEWNFCGQLQSNKIAGLSSFVSLWQTVDRQRLITALAKRNPSAQILVQVNLSQAENKGGCDFDEIESLVAAANQAGLDVQGLMGVGVADDLGATEAAFRRLRAKRDSLGLAHVSMGMSGDLDVALDCGTTMVRVGSSLFGSRSQRAAE